MLLRFVIYVLDGDFFTEITPPYSWTHVVFNFIGPNNGQGIRIYVDGVNTASDTIKTPRNRNAADGRVYAGNSALEKFTSVDLDELLFLNHKLSDQQVALIKNII